jgi:hypothetical protein
VGTRREFWECGWRCASNRKKRRWNWIMADCQCCRIRIWIGFLLQKSGLRNASRAGGIWCTGRFQTKEASVNRIARNWTCSPLNWDHRVNCLAC